MRSTRLFLAALVASLSTVLIAASPASAAPPAPNIDQVITTVRTFNATPSAGTQANPEVVVSGVTSGNTVTLNSNGTPVTTCVASATIVHFNGTPSGCTAAAPFSLVGGDASYTFTATQTLVASTSPASNSFVYFLDSKKPNTPSSVNASQLPDDALRVTWPVTGDDTSSGTGSGVASYHVFRSVADAPTPTGTYTDITTVPASACTGSGVTACHYDDVPASAAVDPKDGKRYFYKVEARDLAENKSDQSAPSPAAAPGVQAVVVPTPSITSVGGSSTNPTFKPDLTATTPTVVVAVGRGGGSVTVYDGAVAIATKVVAADAATVTLQTADYLAGKGAGPRANPLTAVQTVGTNVSPASTPFSYVLPPATPSIDSVGTRTTSPGKAAFTQPDVKVSWVGSATSDTVSLYYDDCAGGAKTLVHQKTGVSGTTTTFVGAAGDWEDKVLAAGSTYCLTVTDVDTTIADAATSASARSAPFQFERAPIVTGYLLDSRGGLLPVNGAAAAVGAPHFGFDIARKVVALADGTGGYVLDGWGGVHPWHVGDGTLPPPLVGTPYWNGWDIARDIVLTGTSKGYVLDGWGGVHPFGGALPVTATGSWSGWDIARSMVMLPDNTGGYVLDGWGGLHPFKVGANPMPPGVSGGPSWAGFDIARDVVLTAPTKGYVLDGWGGVHPFGGAAYTTASHFTSGADIHKTLVLTEVDKDGGYVLDTAGRMSTWGDSLAIPRASLSVPYGQDLVMFTR